jgi:hypothetical protein
MAEILNISSNINELAKEPTLARILYLDKAKQTTTF